MVSESCIFVVRVCEGIRDSVNEDLSSHDLVKLIEQRNHSNLTLVKGVLSLSLATDKTFATDLVDFIG